MTIETPHAISPEETVEVIVYRGRKGYDFGAAKFKGDVANRVIYEHGRVSKLIEMYANKEDMLRLGYDDIDETNNYIILVIDGEEATFRSEYVDVFIY